MKTSLKESTNTPHLDPYAGWEKLYGHPLSEADRLEIGTNLKGFFGILHKWAQEDAQKEAEAKGGQQ